ncbi:MAG: amino acid ABC transporter permease [Nocardioidaceae bacterium]
MAADRGSARAADIVAVPVRHYGRWIGAAATIVVAALVVYAFSNAIIDYGTTGEFFTTSSILSGMVNTVIISVLAQALGIGLGILAAVMRLSKNPVTSSIAGFYIWFMRGTPVLVQLLIWYNLAFIFPTISIPGIGTWATNDVMTPFLAALLGLGINEGAYMAEIVRAGIGSVDEGQTEAAHALGMTSTKTLRRIVLPQAMRVIVPPTGNEFINMLKTSSLAYAIQYEELLQSAVKIYSNNLMVIELLFTISLWYLILTSVFSIFQYQLERRFSRGSKSGQPVNQLAQLVKNLRPGREKP